MMSLREVFSLEKKICLLEPGACSNRTGNKRDPVYSQKNLKLLVSLGCHVFMVKLFHNVLCSIHNIHNSFGQSSFYRVIILFSLAEIYHCSVRT